MWTALRGLGILISAGLLIAQGTGFTFDVGAGFTAPVQHTDGRTNFGYNIVGRAEYNFISRFGLLGEFSYNELGLSSPFLASAGAKPGPGEAGWNNLWLATKIYVQSKRLVRRPKASDRALQNGRALGILCHGRRLSAAYVRADGAAGWSSEHF